MEDSKRLSKRHSWRTLVRRRVNLLLAEMYEMVCSLRTVREVIMIINWPM